MDDLDNLSLFSSPVPKLLVPKPQTPRPNPNPSPDQFKNTVQDME